MKCLHLSLFLLTLLCAACSHTPLLVNSGNQDDIAIYQGGLPAVAAADGALHLRGEEFEIRSRWPQVNVCISRSRADLGKTSAGMDTVREAGTCLNLGKAYAMEAEADYLVTGDGFNALNDAHGMRRTGRYYSFPVRAFFDAKRRKDVPLAQAAGQYYLLFWVDRNSDLRVDGGEYAFVSVLLER